MQLDPVLEGLHGRMSLAEGSLILLTELRGGVIYRGGHGDGEG